MNAAELKIKSAIMTQGRERMTWVNKITCDSERETVTFELDNPLESGEAYIGISFSGTLNDNLCGFYRSKYALPDNTERYMATTQFEAIDARRAFPCFDEPSQKATFYLTLIVPEDRTAISNMPMRKEFSIGNGQKAVQFDTTPVMSTYLLAFIVGDLESVEAKTKNNTIVRVWATPGKKDQCAFALDVGVRALEYFENYFGIPYSLPKLDMAAIPDFDPGAMENWGLVTYREVALLFDEKHSSTAVKQRVASIIAHELAHQWFGDLVTMKWWNDLWLNEAFASFMGDKAVDHLFPEWKVWDRFYIDDTARGLSLDGLASSHPIEADIQDPKEIGQIFDAISYSKGAAVLRMLENYIGEDAFRNGVSLYLRRHSYGNAETADLWRALEEISGKPVREIMDTWTSQQGYPVVEASRFKYESLCALELRQTRFLYLPDTNDPNKDTMLWKVPVSIGVPVEQRPRLTLLEESEKKVCLAAPRDVAWVKLNFGQNGFFRIKYSPKMLKDLSTPMQNRSLPTIDRMGILNDLWALSRACAIPATDYLTMAEHCRNETEYPVWAELNAGLSGIMALVEQEPYSEDLKTFVQTVLTPLGNRMGWDPTPNEGELDPLLRSLALGQLGYCGDERVVEEAKQRFALLCLNPPLLNPNLRGVVCAIAATHGLAATHKTLLRLYRAASLKEEQMRYLQAMGLFKSKALLQKTLLFALSSEVRHENTAFVLNSVASNPHGRDLAWEFFKDNWEELRGRYEHSMFTLGRIIVGIVSGFVSYEAKMEVTQFFAEHPVPEANMVLRQSLERVDMNIAWLEHNRDSVDQWLKERKDTT